MALCPTLATPQPGSEADGFYPARPLLNAAIFILCRNKEITMSMKRYGVEGGKGTGGQYLPFARAVEANGWLYVSGQVPMVNGEVVEGNIVVQSHQAIRNLMAILQEAGYGPEDVVRCGVWLDDPRDFQSFNGVFRQYFGENPPARACVVSSMVVDCKVEIDCIAYKEPAS
jgi:reactive intermediate/imine deaminase